MIVDYISDLHVDFYLDNSQHTIEHFKERKLFKIFSQKKGEVLVIAGDIGHHNAQNIFVLKAIKELFDYKKIFLVLGNHDYYLLSYNLIDKYKSDSINRVNDIKKLCNKEENIHLLMGDIVEYKGVKFGGTGMWYDGKYLERLDITMNKKKINTRWKESMRDASSIYGINRYDALFKSEIEKLRLIYDKADVIITHINPSINPSHTHRQYILNKMNGFYSFDGEYYLENTSAKYWVFGHTHKTIEYEVYDTKVVCNPLGYPQENCNFELKSFEI